MESFSHSKLSCYYHAFAAIFMLLNFSIKVPLITCSATKILSYDETNTDFIKTSCGVTMYPKLCFETISPYAKSIKSSSTALANAALSVSLKGAQSTLNNISKLSKGKNLSPGEAHAISDCVENMKDSITELQESLVEMKGLEGPDFEEKMGNVMSWVSGALTDEDTCMDGFEGNDINESIKGSIGSYIVDVAQLSSNALALIKNISSTRVNSR